MSELTLYTLESIKRDAKLQKKTFPELSHTQRLDHAAREKTNLQHYHEVQARVKTHLDSLLEKDSDTALCTYCGYAFCLDVEGDEAEHREVHLQYEKAHHRLGKLPKQHEGREAEKRVAYKNMKDVNLSFKERIDAALQLIQAHFDRSLDSAIMGEYDLKHPNFDNYVAMAIAGDSYNKVIPDDLINHIKEHFGEQPGHIDKGRSYWKPKD